MAEFYSEIRLTHIVAVIASGVLFFGRGLGYFAGHDWPMRWPVRMTVYAIDTTLLTAALMLTTIIHQYPFADGWLTAKVLLLVVYIFLGYLAYWSARPRRMRMVCWIGALAAFGLIVAIARAHHPLGLLSTLSM